MNNIANLNWSASIQVLTICLISSGVLSCPALAMTASLIGKTIIIDRTTPVAIVRLVINRKFLCGL